MISLINQPDFQEELDVALKNAQINLPPKWIFEAKKVQEFPEDALIYAPGEIGVILSRIESLPLQIRTQTGQTKESVTSLSKDQRVNIGRGEESLQANGQWVKNGIIFLNEGDDGFESAKGNPNEKVSRAHAYVEYDPDTYQYKIAAYPGGLPPRNKTQILRANIKISLSELAQQHSVALQPGDQIRLGDEVILLVEVENEATPESTTPNPSENEQI
jgi:pSer/pThr/pTyr-binding forkhead associated (FHA) protein